MNLIHTGHRGFDNLANGPCGYVGKGNVISPTQYSFHLRAWKSTECNGRTFAPGQLQASDLEGLRLGYPEVYAQLTRYLEQPGNHFEGQAGWVYVVRHVLKKKPVVHGVLLATYEHNKLLSFSRGQVTRDRRESLKSQAVMEVLTPLLLAA